MPLWQWWFWSPSGALCSGAWYARSIYAIVAMVIFFWSPSGALCSGAWYARSILCLCGNGDFDHRGAWYARSIYALVAMVILITEWSVMLRSLVCSFHLCLCSNGDFDHRGAWYARSIYAFVAMVILITNWSVMLRSLVCSFQWKRGFTHENTKNVLKPNVLRHFLKFAQGS